MTIQAYGDMITAVFENMMLASEAVEHLVAAGIAADKISVLSKTEALALIDQGQSGFWNRLASFLFADGKLKGALRIMDDGNLLIVVAGAAIDEEYIVLDILDLQSE